MSSKSTRTHSPDSWNRIRELFDRCLELAPDDREPFIDDICRRDPAAGEAVRELMRVHQDASPELLEVPAARILGEDFRPFRLGKYFLLERLGTGGMAEVYRAKTFGPSGFEKEVAVKRILPQYVREPEFRRLFEREARLCSTLTHANIAQIHDFAQVGQYCLLVMEHVRGRNLARILQRMRHADYRCPPALAAFIVNEMAKGLAHAHQARNPRTGEPLGIIHRDVSPKNVMISWEGEVKLVDFGIAKAGQAAGTHQTQAGSIRGTVGYMSPEQARGEPLDPRSDLFSAAAVLFELIAGEPLFPTESPMDTLERVRRCRDVDNRVEGLAAPESLKEILQRALSREREFRYGSASDFHRDLQGYLNTVSPPLVAEDLQRMLAQLFGAESRERTLDPPQPPTLVAVPGRRPPSPAAGNRRLFLGAALALCVAVGMGIVVLRPRREAASVGPAPAVGMCSARIESSPPGAVIRVDGREMGSTPATIEVPCRRAIDLSLRHPSGATLSHRIVVEDKNSSLSLILR